MDARREAVRGGGGGGGGRGGRLGEEEEGREVRMSVSDLARGPHFLLRLAIVVVVAQLVAPLHAIPHIPHATLPHSLPHRLSQLLLRTQYKGGVLKFRGTRSALAPPTVTSLRPPDRSGHRSHSNIGGSSSIGGSNNNVSPPIVASQSPAVTTRQHNHRTNHNTHHHYHHDNQNTYQGSVAPVATASSRSRPWGGNQRTNSHHDTGSWAEGEEGILIYGQGGTRGNRESGSRLWDESSDLNGNRRLGLDEGVDNENNGWVRGEGGTRGNRESSRRLVDESSDLNGNRQLGLDEGVDSGDNGWVRGEGGTRGNRESGRRIVDESSDLNGHRRLGLDEGVDSGDNGRIRARGEGNALQEAGGNPREQEDVWREDVNGGWDVERIVGGRGRGSEAPSRNDTFGHRITEDLSHLSSRNSQGRNQQDINTRRVWVLEEIPEEEEMEGGSDVEGEEVLDGPPSMPVNKDFLNAYIHAVQQQNGVRPNERGHSSSPSSSHPSFTGSSSYHHHRSSSSPSSHPSFTGVSSYPSQTYSSNTRLQDDLSQFHQSIVPQPRPVKDHADEFEPEDYINYQEYGQRGRNTFPQDNRQSSETNQHSNVATHNRHRTLNITDILRLKGFETRDELMQLLTRKGINYNQLLEFVNRGATESQILAFLNRPNIDGADRNRQRMQSGNDRENEMDGEEVNDDDIIGQRGEPGKKRKKGRRNRGRGGKNRRGRNKGRRRGRIGQIHTTTLHPPIPPPILNATNTPSSTPFSILATEDPQMTNTTSTLPPIHGTFESRGNIPPSLHGTIESPGNVQPSLHGTSESQDTVPPSLHGTIKSPATIPEDSPGKTAVVSEITVTVKETPGGKTRQESEETVVEDLRPARRRPNLQERPPINQYDRRHRGEIKQRGDRQNLDMNGKGAGSMAENPNVRTYPIHTREKQAPYKFPVKGIMIISGLMGALAVFTLVVLISYACIKCSKKPVVNNYQVSEQKNAVAS